MALMRMKSKHNEKGWINCLTKIQRKPLFVKLTMQKWAMHSITQFSGKVTVAVMV